MPTMRIFLLALFVGEPLSAAETPPTAEHLKFFEAKVRPLLVQKCVRCHGPKKQEGGLRLDTGASLRAGGDSGEVVVPGKPDKSALIRAVRHDGKEMPPDEKLAAEQIAILERWVRDGATWPAETGTSRVRGDITAEDRAFWAFQPVKDVAVPIVKDATWPRGAIDRFVLARLEAAKLTPVPNADRRTLLRRVTFGLTGLPPTPEEVAAFTADSRPDAYERLVDRLLASPAYGERWGRHWLDVVRYADTAGDNSDYPVPEAWRYRNGVLAALNADRPYDEFVQEQIAGDLMTSRSPDEASDRLIATGYLASSRRFGSYEDKRYPWYLTIEDTIENVGRSVLGLSLSCARCHDHKFDPIPTTDYYALYGFFQSTRYPWPGTELDKKPHDLVSIGSRNEMAYAVAEGKRWVGDAKVQISGDPLKAGKPVPRRFLSILGGTALPTDARGSGRLDLARWLTDAKNPLTARVLVNRLWLHHFGRGLVPTPNDFGRQGQSPSHPELLDHLAARFVEGGWSLKAMHRRIVLSNTYRRSSDHDADNARTDPDNVLLWRANRRRLDAEAIRDALLSVSGLLDRTPGMAHPFPAVSTWTYTQHAPFKAVYETDRRAVYLMTQRIQRHPYLALFDGADTNASTARRMQSTTPLQALYLMNDPFMHRLAEGFAARILREGHDDAGRIERSFLLAFGRLPSGEERETATDLLAKMQAKQGEKAWTAFARALFLTSELVYLD